MHKIAILDIRILNCDRNDDNILIRKEKKKAEKGEVLKLIPIDHALSFPDCFAIADFYLAWTSWD